MVKFGNYAILIDLCKFVDPKWWKAKQESHACLNQARTKWKSKTKEKKKGRVDEKQGRSSLSIIRWQPRQRVEIRYQRVEP